MSMIEILAQKVPFGRENAISRKLLARELGICDRRMREAVEQARADGLMIVNNGDGSGYYQTEDLDELFRQYKRDTAGAMAILRRRNPLREKLKAAGYEV